MNSEGMLSDNPKAGIHPTDVARTVSTNGGNPGSWQGGDVVVVRATGTEHAGRIYDCHGNGDGKTVPTLTGDHMNRVTDYTAVLVCSEFALCIGNGQTNQSVGDVAGALNCMHDQQAIIQKAKPPRKFIVRRLTPTECGRLQGFPDGWTDGANGSDTAIYKMWGNGIALPCAVDVMRRIAKELKKGETE